jgi:membrane-bound inhibitor of C-type lysozyme
LFFLIALTAAAAIAADRPELNGTWQLSSTHDARLKFETLLIEQTPDGVKITESGAKEKTVDFACAVDASECKLKDGAISFWYNGTALVMMETHRNRDVVTKTRLVPAEDGKSLNLEVTRVSPPGPSSTYTFKKQP